MWGSTMQKTLLAAALAAALGMAGSASAADLNSAGGMKDGGYVPVNSWTGFYLGGNVGYGENGSSTDITSLIDGEAFATSAGFSSKGAFGGVQAGYNMQRDRFVYGVETDMHFAGLNSSKDVLTDVDGLTRHLEQNVNWFGTVRGRLGYAFGSTLVFATGGLAYAGVDSKVVSSILSAIPVAHYGRNSVETGYTVGGGVEYQINPSWSAKAEYQYIDLGGAQLHGTYLGGAIDSNKINNNFDTVQIGFNYHLYSASDYMPMK
jgi:outer membrane immunogenic protein